MHTSTKDTISSQQEYLDLQLISVLNFYIYNYTNSVLRDFYNNNGKNFIDIALIVSIGSYNKVLATGYIV